MRWEVDTGQIGSPFCDKTTLPVWPILEYKDLPSETLREEYFESSTLMLFPTGCLSSKLLIFLPFPTSKENLTQSWAIKVVSYPWHRAMEKGFHLNSLLEKLLWITQGLGSVETFPNPSTSPETVLWHGLEDESRLTQASSSEIPKMCSVLLKMTEVRPIKEVVRQGVASQHKKELQTRVHPCDRTVRSVVQQAEDRSGVVHERQARCLLRPH
jgi:hypothetical protein